MPHVRGEEGSMSCERGGGRGSDSHERGIVEEGGISHVRGEVCLHKKEEMIRKKGHVCTCPR